MLFIRYCYYSSSCSPNSRTAVVWNFLLHFAKILFQYFITAYELCPYLIDNKHVVSGDEIKHILEKDFYIIHVYLQNLLIDKYQQKGLI